MWRWHSVSDPRDPLDSELTVCTIIIAALIEMIWIVCTRKRGLFTWPCFHHDRPSWLCVTIIQFISFSAVKEQSFHYEKSLWIKTKLHTCLFVTMNTEPSRIPSQAVLSVKLLNTIPFVCLHRLVTWNVAKSTPTLFWMYASTLEVSRVRHLRIKK